MRKGIYGPIEGIIISILNSRFDSKLIELADKWLWLSNKIFLINAVEAILWERRNTYFTYGRYYYTAMSRVLKYKFDHAGYEANVEQVKLPASTAEALNVSIPLDWYKNCHR
jgi:hypothetical protein